MRNNKFKLVVVFFLSIFFLSGCAVILQKGRRSDADRISSLEEELRGLRSTKSILEDRLSKEIEGDQVRLQMQDKGLVITFLAEVLFDSGKIVLRENSLAILDKLTKVLKEEVPDNNIGIEGHTDNQPIKHSGWKSNWELSAHRALSVLHYLESKGISPERLSASGYGQYRSVAANDTPGNRQLNRRVEVVIIPRFAKQMESGSGEEGYEEELK